METRVAELEVLVDSLREDIRGRDSFKQSM